jgi:hypothetical protein
MIFQIAHGFLWAIFLYEKWKSYLLGLKEDSTYCSKVCFNPLRYFRIEVWVMRFLRRQNEMNKNVFARNEVIYWASRRSPDRVKYHPKGRRNESRKCCPE